MECNAAGLVVTHGWEQSVFQRMGLFAGQQFSVAERLARRGFHLPSGLGLRDGDIERGASALRQVVA
jgi:perosamine synthetase